MLDSRTEVRPLNSQATEQRVIIEIDVPIDLPMVQGYESSIQPIKKFRASL